MADDKALRPPHFTNMWLKVCKGVRFVKTFHYGHPMAANSRLQLDRTLGSSIDVMLRPPSCSVQIYFTMWCVSHWDVSSFVEYS